MPRNAVRSAPIIECITAPADEHALIRRIVCGDRAAFETLYRAYAPRLRAFLERLLRRQVRVDEVLDDTMLVVWRKANAYDASSKLSTWIFAIAHRKALKVLRRTCAAAMVPAANADAFHAGPESELQRLELREQLTRALMQLNTNQRDVLQLVYLEGYACREVADLMNCPIDTVKTRAFHARRKLRSLLSAVRPGNAEAVRLAR